MIKQALLVYLQDIKQVFKGIDLYLIGDIRDLWFALLQLIQIAVNAVVNMGLILCSPFVFILGAPYAVYIRYQKLKGQDRGQVAEQRHLTHKI